MPPGSAPRAAVIGCLALGLVLAAAAPSFAQDLELDIVNAPPTIVSVTLGSSSLTPTAGSTTQTTATIVVSDLNGYNDVTGVTVEILKPDGSTTHAAAVAASFGSGSGLTATYTRTISMNYYDAAATGLSTYKVKVVATDTAAATGNNLADLATFNYAELAAVNVASSTLTLGSNVSPGATTSATSLSIGNYGNVVIDAQVSGTALAHGSLGASIPASAIKYSLASDMSGSAALSGTAATLTTFDLAAGSGSTKSIYWQATIPGGSTQWVPPGTYTGTLTVGAVAG